MNKEQNIKFIETMSKIIGYCFLFILIIGIILAFSMPMLIFYELIK